MKTFWLGLGLATILTTSACSSGVDSSYAPLPVSDSTVRAVFSDYDGLDRQGLQCDAIDDGGFFCTILQTGESTIDYQKDASDPEAYKTLTVVFEDSAMAASLGLPDGGCSGIDELPENRKAYLGLMGIYAQGFQVTYLPETVDGVYEMDSMTEQQATEINERISPALMRIGKDLGVTPTTLNALCGVD
jgi:hypothetical protein